MSTTAPYLLLFLLAAPLPGMIMGWLGYRLWLWMGDR